MTNFKKSRAIVALLMKMILWINCTFKLVWCNSDNQSQDMLFISWRTILDLHLQVNPSASDCYVFVTPDLNTWFLLTSSRLILLNFVINPSNFLLFQNIYDKDDNLIQTFEILQFIQKFFDNSFSDQPTDCNSNYPVHNLPIETNYPVHQLPQSSNYPVHTLPAHRSNYPHHEILNPTTHREGNYPSHRPDLYSKFHFFENNVSVTIWR